MKSVRIREDLNLKDIGSLLKLNKRKTQAVQPTQESIAKVTWKTNRYCPQRLARAIYKKQLSKWKWQYISIRA